MSSATRAAVANDPHAHVALDQLVHVAAEIEAEQTHQRPHFLRRAFPVLRREGEQGEVLQADVAGLAHDLAHRVHAGDMAGLARQVALLRPASVAVHDDGDVVGKTAVTRRDGHTGFPTTRPSLGHRG